MKEVQDRVVQFSNRYKLTDAGTGTELGTYDFEEVTGTVQQAGTPIDKELFDSIKKDIDDIVDGTTPIANTVRYNEQTLNSQQQTQARTNIGAASDADVTAVEGDITKITNGTTPIANTVRYNAQTLTTEQQEQARENIGALGEDDIKINLNGAEVTSPSFYAPTTSGTAGQVLKSMGEGQAPVWVDEPKDIANASVTLGASLTFNGSAQEQTITSVTFGGTPLSEGTDYEVTGNIATDAGNYTMAIMGIGNYTGTLWVDWSIAKAQGSISVPASVDIIGAVGTQKQVTVVIGNGYGDIFATSSAPSVVTAVISGNVINLTLVSDGNATITINMVGNYQASATISVSAFIVSAVLSENTAATIRAVADNDLGENYWAVGDTYPVPLNGTVGTKTYDNVTVWAYILGFNHNPEVEGEHLIHFGGFKTAQTGGIDICLDDSHYANDSTSGAKWFNMNHSSDTNSGGWKGCDMRYDILGSTDTNNGEPTTTCATDPVSGTLMAAFPADLRAVMRPATKYTDNTGGGNNNASYVTATQDYMPFLAEFEVQGARSYANSTEQNYQTQYAYYANGNSKVKYRQTSTGSAARWWCRSPDASNSNNFCAVDVNSSSTRYGHVSYSRGVSPAFFI